MAFIIQVVIIGIGLICLPTLVSPTSWFYNAPQALFGFASSASASASAPASHAPYIADLRRKQEKSEQLQNVKGLTEEAELLDSTSSQDESKENGGGENEGNNEVSPSLLEKKVGKILTKLRLIAQIKNAYHYSPEVNENESNITFNITSINHNQDVTKELQKEDIKEHPNIEPRLATIKVQSENIEAIRPALEYGIPRVLHKTESENVPLKIDLDVNQVNGKLEDFNSPSNKKLRDQEPAKFGTIGIFFVELLGSILGLTYGALAQITSGGQSPVTISTSEGL